MYANRFRSFAEEIREDDSVVAVGMKQTERDSRTGNLATADSGANSLQVVCRAKTTKLLEWFSILHPGFLALRFPLLFLPFRYTIE